MTKHILTQEVLKELIHYDPETGIFTWKVRDRKYCYNHQSWACWNTQNSGNVTGYIDSSGYRVIGIFRKLYKAHRLAFLYIDGSFPERDVDHINGLEGDNRWVNLRRVNESGNLKNTKLHIRNKSGVMGVWWYERYEKYQVRITDNRKKFHLGYFEDFFEACCARKSAEIKYGYHENHGRR